MLEVAGSGESRLKVHVTDHCGKRETGIGTARAVLSWCDYTDMWH